MTPLEAELKRLIALDGPLPLTQYMALCLTDPVHGYYVTRDPFGAGGDFTTAPEISQMFGELVGLWTASVWRQLGAPWGSVLSTPGDLARFARMMLSGGTLDVDVWGGYAPMMMSHYVNTGIAGATTFQATLPYSYWTGMAVVLS